MADILIRMEMPNNVFDCPLNSFGICNLAQDETHCDCIGDSRPEWCPIAPLPEGHGKLGDLDEIVKRLNEMEADFDKKGFHQGACWVHVIAELLRKAPTIVPAEGGTDDARMDFRQGEDAAPETAEGRR